jgi:drug/metabolite transporter (DMT)-like permease
MVEIPLAPLWAFVLFGETVARDSLIGGAVIVVAVLANLAWSAWRRTSVPLAPH